MEIPYNAVSKILGGKDGSKDTVTDSGPDAVTDVASVDSQTNTAVEHELVNKTHEEKVENVVEKERHQHHYHTTVQPLEDREVLPEEHKYQQATKERTFDHEDDDMTREKLGAEKPGLQNTSTNGGTTVESKTESTVAGGEEVHHHFHETVQPVIEKETVKPTVTHTKVLIHETHQEPSVVHGTSTAGTMTVDEFQKAGNTLETSK